MRFYDQLPQRLRELAYHAGRDYAWNKQCTIEVIEALTQLGAPIYGIEVWLATTPGPTIPGPFIYHWTAPVGADPHEANKAAREYVRLFEWDDSDEENKSNEPYFNITSI